MLREEEFDARGNRQVPRGFFVGPDEVFRILTGEHIDILMTLKT
jgi:hypothetical protein